LPVGFDNPPINMLGPEAMIELQGLVGQFENDPECHFLSRLHEFGMADCRYHGM
jgi:hypothetical protein